MFDKVANGAASLPLAISAIGLPSFAAWAAALASAGETMSMLRSIDCSKSFLEISSAPPEGTRFDTTMTLVCGALVLSQARMRIVSRVAASVSSLTTTATWASWTMCGYWMSMWRGRSSTVDSNAFFISSCSWK